MVAKALTGVATARGGAALPPLPSGVNVAGYLRTESGVGEAARGYVRALHTLGLPVTLFDLSELSGNRAEDHTLALGAAERCHDVNLVCTDVQLHFAAMTRLGEDFFRHRYNIGIWAWELPRFPERWHDRLGYYDEAWVGSSFIANALAPIAPFPVVRVPPVLGAQVEGSRPRGRARLGAAPDEFVFLFVFDVHSQLTRKNPLAAIEAFRLAFSPAERVRLVLKSVNGHADPTGLAGLGARAEGHRVDMHDGYWSSQDVRDLMAACDAYVSLHRAEGTGLTIAEAMSLGKPVIATDWSGNTDFMDSSNSFPVRYRLVEIERDAGQYHRGETWAEPSVEHAAELMRSVFVDRAAALARAEAARADIRRTYSEEAVASLIDDRLRLIAAHDRHRAMRQRLQAGVRDVDEFAAAFRDLGPYVPTGHLHYQRLVARVRGVAAAALPPDAAVLVVSRGDDALLELGGRLARHFPQDPSGLYAGHHPADSAAAVAHLEQLRAQGAAFLLLPATAAWWLDHYPGFARHLARFPRVVDDPDTCLIFALAEDHGG